jgi:hypothetical protein
MGVLKIFKGASYVVICVVGLTGLIDIISTVINTVLAIVQASLWLISSALFITKESVGESMAKFLVISI